jgi:adenylate cyclase
MTRHSTVSTSLMDATAAWLADQALGNSESEALFDGLCQRIRAAGIPIIRGYAAFRVLHPLYHSHGLNWRISGISVEMFPVAQGTTAEWLRSPMYHAISHGLPVLRRRLTGAEAMLDFEVLKDLRELGGHDYLLLTIPFDQSRERGIECSWLCGRPSGFTDSEIAALQALTHRLAGALKARIERHIAQNVATAYLGERAGRAVLSGAIHRGDGEKIQAALWYSDLRQSSTIADGQSAEAFLALLNRYFEMTAAAVQDSGGEVVSFIGDAVLGFFRVEGAASDACERALSAARKARRALRALEHQPDQDRLDFGVGLHLGEVIYGNVGIPGRLQFTLVGTAVNEVARVEGTTKTLGVPLIATAVFARELSCECRSLGVHSLRGIGKPTELFTPELAD